MRTTIQSRSTHPFGVAGLLEVLNGPLGKGPLVEVVLEVLEGKSVLEDVTASQHCRSHYQKSTYVSVTARLAGAAETARAERMVAATANFMLIIKFVEWGCR